MTPIMEIRVVAPSVVAVNEPFSLGLRVLTKPYYAEVRVLWLRHAPSVAGPFNLSPRGTRYMDNVPSKWSGNVTIDGGKDYLGPKRVAFADGNGPHRDDSRPIRRIGGFRFTATGIHFIRMRDTESGIEALSNPIGVQAQEPAERLFWGDLHVHTFLGDAIRCPEDIYAFARNEAFLDICALSEHSEFITNAQWEYLTLVTNQFNDPGRFVTLVGGEWTSMEHGHRNYYYRGDCGPILRCTEPAHATLGNLHAAARRQNALVIPHHPANTVMGVDWSKGHDPVGERLVEIHSVWGNSERPAARGNPLPIQFAQGEKAGQHVVDALARGYRFGFIGGGDIHDGRPGDSLANLQDRPEDYHLVRCNGLMGVWAKELTREAIFDALWNRRVYATTSQRTWLKFSINGHPMGSEISSAGELTIHIEAAGDSPIQRLELVRNGEDIQLHEPMQRVASWRTREPRPREPSWYYARVTRQDGHLAWSSPIWIG